MSAEIDVSQHYSTEWKSFDTSIFNVKSKERTFQVTGLYWESSVKLGI